MNIPDKNRAVVVRSTRAHEVFDIGRTQFHAVAKTPGFPQKIVLGRKARGYIVAELERWAAESAERAA